MNITLDRTKEIEIPTCPGYWARIEYKNDRVDSVIITYFTAYEIELMKMGPLVSSDVGDDIRFIGPIYMDINDPPAKPFPEAVWKNRNWCFPEEENALWVCWDSVGWFVVFACDPCRIVPAGSSGFARLTPPSQ